MKISKQLLKEIIIEEYKTFLLEQAAFASTINPAIKRFKKALQSQGGQETEEGSISMRTTGVMDQLIDTYLQHFRKRTQPSAEEYDQIENEIRRLEPTTAYGLYLQRATESLNSYLKSYIETGAFKPQILNQFSMAINMATKNINRSGHGQLRAPDPLGGATQVFTME